MPSSHDTVIKGGPVAHETNEASQHAQSSEAGVLALAAVRERHALQSYWANNPGDEIQSIASEQFLPKIDFASIANASSGLRLGSAARDYSNDIGGYCRTHG
jgi:hypothetical protein